MKIKIAIPTLNRPEKLKKCLSSIKTAKKDYDVVVNVYTENKDELCDYLLHYDETDFINWFLIQSYNVPIFWNDRLNEKDYDILVYLNDDITVDSFFFEYLIDSFNKNFPNLDGLIGINQQNIPEGQKLESAFGGIGKNFINNFENGQVWCPDYNRFYADNELMLYAKKMNKFYYDESIKITHYHPAYFPQLKDQTHTKARKYLYNDKANFNKRRELNYLWGLDYNKVGV